MKKEFLERLIASMPTAVVTNSETVKVREKLERLKPNNLDRITLYGNAKKYKIDNAWTEVPEGLKYDGLSRPILIT